MRNEIALLDQVTIDKIAAGEVVERPSSIVKELVENAIDAGASAITVEIKGGGIQLIRITDNGSGISSDQVRIAFMRHATSKIRAIDDLQQISSLGFRGEALSSIAAVAQVELITKTADALAGIRYTMEGGVEKELEEIGAPNGTTFIIRNLFYNTPARAKFLKSPTTEGSYIGTLLEQMAMSHPGISFKFMNAGQTKLSTSGNQDLKEVIYQIYGREVTRELLELRHETEQLSIHGFIGKPSLSRGNRAMENYYVNDRYVKNQTVTKAIEDGYKSFLMQHRFPCTVLFLEVKKELVDVNVHPSKKEVRFSDQEGIYREIYRAINQTLSRKELIPEVSFMPERKKIERQPIFEIQVAKPAAETPAPVVVSEKTAPAKTAPVKLPEPFEIRRKELEPPRPKPFPSGVQEDIGEYKQESLFEDNRLLDPKNKKKHQIIGQVFATYWLVEMEEKLFIIDQHAAHEKVMYERFIHRLKTQESMTQNLAVPLVISVDLRQQAVLETNLSLFCDFGFLVEPFGDKEYAIRGVPYELYGKEETGLFLDLLDGLQAAGKNVTEELFAQRIATMACKAAVKGNHTMSRREVDVLIDELLDLDQPYHCPHGRPTIISMTKYDLEKKFKRIV